MRRFFLPSFRRRRLCTVIWSLLLIPFAQSLATSTTPQDAEHLIVTPSEFAAAFAPLAQHRSQTGVASVVVTLEDIVAGATGRDDAETLRDYLVELHALGSLRYLLLAGDSDRVPARLVRDSFYPPASENDLPSDLYYAGLDGDWDADGDGIFGEAAIDGSASGDGADLEPELRVGRAPVGTLAEAQRFVAGVLGYETQEQTHPYDSTLLLAEVLFPTNWTGGAITLDGAVYGEAIATSLLSHPLPSRMTRLYENAAPFPDAIPLTMASAVLELNSGDHGTVFYVGHGGGQLVSMGDGTLGLSDFAALTNAPHYSVAVALSPQAAAFSSDCILEEMVTAPGGGSAAAIGFSAIVFLSTAGDFVEGIFERLSADVDIRLGDAVFDVLRAHLPPTDTSSSERLHSLGLQLFGDPAMPYRSAEARVPIQVRSIGALKERFD